MPHAQCQVIKDELFVLVIEQKKRLIYNKCWKERDSKSDSHRILDRKEKD